jgi:release factor glutamine methyltransferase
LAAAAARLAAAGVPDPRRDARLLVAHALGVAPQSVFTRPEMTLDAEQRAFLDTLVGRRAAREPVSRILGRRGFWTLELALGPDTLDPRPDSETVIEAVLAALPDRTRPLRLLDFGTGSGCLLLALLSELPAAWGLGIDRSEGALAVARANAEAAGLAARAAFVRADWGKALGGGLAGWFDVVVANPPYIPDGDIAGLAPEVAAFDPRLALAGGQDGLDCYRALAPQIARLLVPGGVAALEVGLGQAEAVAALLYGAGLAMTEIRPDLGGIARCVVAGRLA